MTRRRWVDLRDSYLDTPERLAARTRAREQLDLELAEYAAQHPEEATLWEFLDRGRAAQAAVDEIIADHQRRTDKDAVVFDGPMNEELRQRMKAAQEQEPVNDGS